MKEKRLSILITKEEQTWMRNQIPWGLVSRVMRILLVQTLKLIDEHGDIVLGAILSGKLTALDVLRKEDDKDAT